jgi:peptide deformylase
VADAYAAEDRMTIDIATVELKYYPDPILKTKCHDVDPLDPDLPLVLDKMVAIMFAFGGKGLAAPQVGLPWNVFIVDLGPQEDPRAIINPTIDFYEGKKIESEEACLSMPGIKGRVERYEQIIVSCCTPKSNDRVTIHLLGEEARVFQHEYDHTQGTVFIDRMRPVAKMMAKKKYLKHKDEILTLREQNKQLRLKAKDIQELIKKVEKEQTNVPEQNQSTVDGCECGTNGDLGCPGVSPDQTVE